MHIFELKAFRGRNIYCHQKVISMIIDLESYNDIPTNKIEGFNDNLLALMPGLKDHHCSLGYAGGFKQRLDKGTYLAHVIEHSCLEILNMLGYTVGFGRARQIDNSSLYRILYAYKDEITGLETGRLVVRMFNAVIENQHFDFSTEMHSLMKTRWKCCLGPSTQAIVEAAIERGIPVTRIGSGSIVQLGYGKYHKKIECTLSDNTSCISVDIACDKTITKDLLMQSGIPVPKGHVCYTEKEAVLAAEDLGYPVVVKPVNANQGRGVSLKLQSPDEVVTAFNIAKVINECILIEEYIKGKDYRILIVGDQMAAAALRIPAHVIGNGEDTISQLVERTNNDERRGEGHEKPLTKICLDNISHNLLRKQGYGLDSIPRFGVIVYLKSNGNISTGGEAIDCTDKISRFNQELAIRAARIIGLDIAGIDITCEDISKPICPGKGAVIEVNAAPGIRMHLYPSKGKSRKIGSTIIDMLFPSGSKHSIPIVSITGTNGKTTTTRMVSHILRTQGLQVGMTTTGGVYINDKCIMKGDTTGPSSAQMLLTDNAVEIAVLETARGGIIRSGLGYDLSDIGVLLNISEDHLGQDGVYTLDDLLHVKSLVVEAVKSNGYAVLNADDPMVVQAAEKVKANIIYFSHQDDSIIIHKHVSEGGIAVFLKDQYINIATGNGLIQSISVEQIPATHGGKLKHNIENSLAAISVAYAMDIPLHIIKTALTSFYSDDLLNPGRFNVYNIRDYRVIVDYAHNIAGYKHVTDAVKKFGASRIIGIIGVPGDRSDECIRTVGFISGETFDRVYIKEDIDLRGRKAGETAKLLEEGVINAGLHKTQIEYVRFETEALKKAMHSALPGDLIVIFYEQLHEVQQLLNNTLNNLDHKKNNESQLFLKA